MKYECFRTGIFINSRINVFHIRLKLYEKSLNVLKNVLIEIRKYNISIHALKTFLKWNLKNIFPWTSINGKMLNLIEINEELKLLVPVKLKNRFYRHKENKWIMFNFINRKLISDILKNVW